MIEKSLEPIAPKIVYPIVRESRATGAWIMFFGHAFGICVKEGKHWKLGEHIDGLIHHEDSLSWTPVEVKISG